MPAVTENSRIQASGYLSLAIPFVERLIFQDVTFLRLVHRTQALSTERLDAVFTFKYADGIPCSFLRKELFPDS